MFGNKKKYLNDDEIKDMLVELLDKMDFVEERVEHILTDTSIIATFLNRKVNKTNE